MNPPIVFECTDCHATAELLPDTDRPGYVSIVPLDGWESPPTRCPKCAGWTRRLADPRRARLAEAFRKLPGTNIWLLADTALDVIDHDG